ncbi:MAG TPA: DUF4124 domain-containing protein [Steroidobacteraceae bacterium]|jgi:hypothetical protein
MRSLLILAGLAISLAAFSQEIYRWVDKDGIVHYSDQPGSSNAELINVIEPNGYEGAEAAPEANSQGDDGSPDSGDDSSGPAKISPYQSLSIVSPTPDQVFFGADAVVNVNADLEGTLRPDHQVVFFLNGNRKPATGLSADFTGLERGTYFLRASILDQDGNPVISSQQITFHIRQPSINSPQSPQAPKPAKPPKPTPKPTPKPAGN